MSRIFWDTNLFIYLFEQHPDFCPIAKNLLTVMGRRGDQMFTSWMTLAEVQVKPKKIGDVAACDQYKRAILNTASVIAFDEKAAAEYVSIRASTSVKGPDAIQLACAAAAGVELFITNDVRLQGLAVPGIHFIVPLDRVPL